MILAHMISTGVLTRQLSVGERREEREQLVERASRELVECRERELVES